MQPIEREIICGLIYDKTFLTAAIPHLKLEYFTDDGTRTIIELIKEFKQKYQAQPTVDSLVVDAQGKIGLTDKQYENIAKTLEDVSKVEARADYRWLLDKTEQYCKDRALYLALTRAIEIVNQSPDSKDRLSKGEIPGLMQDALAVTFDTSIGHDYINDADARFAFYNDKEEHLPFDLTLLNRITGGGLLKKSIIAITAPTGFGKTLMMCHIASSYLLKGKKVLYFTMEMSEKKIAERIDANLLDVDIGLLKDLPVETFQKKIEALKTRGIGDIVVKEFPTGAATANHFRHVIRELKQKKGFVPDAIFVDYLNICASSRFHSGDANSYVYAKAIAEELRGIAVEFDCPLITATQFNRSGSSSSDPSITDTSDSFGVPMTMDLQIAIFSTEEMDHAGKIIVKQLKNRYNSLSDYNKFTLKIDRTKMRLMDDDDNTQAPVQTPQNTNIEPSLVSQVGRSISSGAMVFDDEDEEEGTPPWV